MFSLSLWTNHCNGQMSHGKAKLCKDGIKTWKSAVVEGYGLGYELKDKAMAMKSLKSNNKSVNWFPQFMHTHKETRWVMWTERLPDLGNQVPGRIPFSMMNH